MCGNLKASYFWPRRGLCTFGQNQNEEEFGAHLCDIVVASTRITLPGSGSGQLGSPQRSAPTHLRTLALLGANVGFLSNFSGGSTEPRRFPGADEQAVSWRPWGADVPASVFGLFVHGGGDGAQRVRTHNPSSFPPKFAARSGSLRWKAMASKAGETVGLLSGSCSPQAALCASTPP